METSVKKNFFFVSLLGARVLRLDGPIIMKDAEAKEIPTSQDLSHFGREIHSISNLNSTFYHCNEANKSQFNSIQFNFKFSLNFFKTRYNEIMTESADIISTASNK